MLQLESTSNIYCVICVGNSKKKCVLCLATFCWSHPPLPIQLASQEDSSHLVCCPTQKERCPEAVAQSPRTRQFKTIHFCTFQGTVRRQCFVHHFKMFWRVFVKWSFNYFCFSVQQRVFLKEVFELHNFIDRSQLTPSLGGYLIYSHGSWATFIKVILFKCSLSYVPSRLMLPPTPIKNDIW